MVLISQLNSGSSVSTGGIFSPANADNSINASRSSDDTREEEFPRDRVTLSGEEPKPNATSSSKTESVDAKDTKGAKDPKDAKDAKEQSELLELQSRDRQVRAHEAAHQAAGGSATGSASFAYETGPDGRQYAVGGEVSVKLQPGRTPDETIANARQVRAAALAPPDPSAQDLAVAASAARMEMEALLQKTREATRAYQKGSAAADPLSTTPKGLDATLSATA